MLNELNGYFLGVVTAIVVGIRFFKRNGFRNGMTVRFCFVLILIYYCTVYLSNTIFPMPVQSSVIQSGIHEKKNYLIPFSEFMRMYESNVPAGNMTMETFIKAYCGAVWAYCAKIIPIGLLVKLVVKCSAKKYLTFSALSVVGLELVKITCNLITTVNYISLVSEHILYSFASLWIGFFLYYPVIWFVKSLRGKSNIMSVVYDQLTP